MSDGYDWMVPVCMEHACSDPVRIFRILVRDDSVPMHGPAHHIIVPMSLITAVWSVTRDFDLESYLHEAISRGSEVPPAICGLWGCCGSAVGVGIFYSIMTRTGPLSKGRRWGQCNGGTSKALSSISGMGGPRCCKRNAVLAILSACETVEADLGYVLTPSTYGCTMFADSPECIGSKCPFFSVKNIPKDVD